MNKEIILDRFCIIFFKLAQIKLNHSFYKMPNPTRLLGIIKKWGANNSFTRVGRFSIDKDAFSLMHNLRSLNFKQFKMVSIFELRNGSFDSLNNLEELLLVLVISNV